MAKDKYGNESKVTGNERSDYEKDITSRAANARADEQIKNEKENEKKK